MSSDISQILIVDDDLLFVNDLMEVLEAYGQFKVLAATSRGEELFLLKQEKIAALVVNLHAASLDGLEVLSLISTSYRHIQCIVMIDKEHPSALKSLESCPCRDSIFRSLVKPDNLEVIGCAVLESLQRLDENDISLVLRSVRSCPSLKFSNELLAFLSVLAPKNTLFSISRMVS